MLSLLAVVAVVALWWFTRRRELFRLSVRDGRTRVMRGQVSPGLYSDFADALARPPVARATIRVFLDEDGASLSCSGLDDGREQRLRNVLALYPASRLRAKPAIAKPTLGGLASIAWLASFFDRR